MVGWLEALSYSLPLNTGFRQSFFDEVKITLEWLSIFQTNLILPPSASILDNERVLILYWRLRLKIRIRFIVGSFSDSE
jgi:hypothetical protein